MKSLRNGNSPVNLTLQGCSWKTPFHKSQRRSLFLGKVVSTRDLMLLAPSPAAHWAQREGRTQELPPPTTHFGGSPPRGGHADVGNSFPAAQPCFWNEHVSSISHREPQGDEGCDALKTVNEPFPALSCLTPHPQALCFLQGNSGILQWWKDSLNILHTKKTVVVFHFTWKLMELGIPDVDAQNPLWSLSGDLSSLGCLWCTRVSAEVICELLHTKSRFLREEVCTHTHTPIPTQTPSTPLSCTLLAGPAPKRSDLRKNFSSHRLRWFG